MDQPPPAALAQRPAPAPPSLSTAGLQEPGASLLQASLEPAEEPPSRGRTSPSPDGSAGRRDEPFPSPWTPLLGFGIALSTLVVPLVSVIDEPPVWLPSAVPLEARMSTPLRDPSHGSEPTGGLPGPRTGQPDR